MHAQTNHARHAAGAKCPFAHAHQIGHERAAQPSLADALRESTKEAHARAERHPIQAQMVKGETSREQYAAWLSQMLPMWNELDATLAKLAGVDPRVAAMVKPYHPHAGRIAEDLAFLGHARADLPTVQAAADFAAWVHDAATRKDVAIVGAWYVLEGSSNGGRFIAKAISRALGIQGPAGLKSFDPHGESQRERWQQWRSDLDSQTWSESERSAIIGAAERTFDTMTQVMEELSKSATPSLASR